MNLLFESYYLFILILLVIISFIILRRWRNGIIFIFIWIYLESVIRRLLPGQPHQVMLVKDGLIFLTYFAFFITLVVINNKKPFSLWKPPFLTGFLLFTGWCVVEAFNPVLPNFLFALIGFRSYLWYVPLLFLGYYMFNNEGKLLRFCRILIYTSIPLTIIAIIQYIFYWGSNSVLIRPLEGSHQFHSFGLLEGSGIKLISSIFRSAAVYSSFSLFLFFLGVGLRFYPNNSRKQRFFINISIISAAVGVFISGVRSPMYLLIIGASMYMFVYSRNSLRIAWSQLKSIWLPTIFVLIIIFLIINFGFKDISLYIFHSLDELLWQRTATLLTDMSFAVRYAGVLGLGTGSRSQGLQYIPGGKEWALMGGPEQKEWGVEGGLAKIWYELGPIGALIFIIFFSQMFFSWLRKVRNLKGTTLFSFGLAICMYLVLIPLWSIKGHQVFGDATTLVCFWFFMGVLFRLKNFTNQESRDKKDVYEQST
ncbi:MAG: hypothetical protein IBV53_07110 [Candidatus Atribacteria bacterium]